MNTVKETLLGVKELLSDPNKWGQGMSAMSSDGKPVHATDRAACKFCLLGGLDKVLTAGLLSLIIHCMKKPVLC